MINKILIVVGVRPQFVKAAGLLYLLQKERFDMNLVSTFNLGQHYSAKLSTSIIRELNLNIISEVQFANTTSEYIFSVSYRNLVAYIRANGPFKILVFGDANSTLIGSLAALYTQMPLIHVESGARRLEYEIEHYNSKLTDTIADLKTCLTKRALKCLQEEANGKNAFFTGDLSIPFYRKLINDNKIETTTKTNYILVSLHRPYNCSQEVIDQVLEGIILSNIKIKWIVHPRIKPYLKKWTQSKIDFLPPQSHIAVLRLLAKCKMVLTDSGGLARESYYLGKPIIMRRDKSGWTELNQAGVLDYASPKAQDIKQKIEQYMDKKISVENNIFDNPKGRKIGIDKIINLQTTSRSFK